MLLILKGIGFMHPFWYSLYKGYMTHRVSFTLLSPFLESFFPPFELVYFCGP